MTTIKIDKASLRALLACVSKDAGRTMLHSIAIDGLTLVSTDGHRMMVAECAEGEVGRGRTQVIPVAAYKLAYKAAGAKSEIDIWCGCATYEIRVDGTLVATGGDLSHDYPPWRQVIPEAASSRWHGEIGLNPIYLADLALMGKATHGVGTSGPLARMQVGGKLDPVVWRSTSYGTPVREWTYAVMPMRI